MSSQASSFFELQLILTHDPLVATFSERFLKKVGFPEKPELFSDVPSVEDSDFVPGQDKLYEEIIEDEREEAKDSDSLTIVLAGEQSESEDKQVEEEEIEEEIQVIMPPRAKFASSKEPNKQPGQCEVSWELLHPVIGLVDVEDPQMRRRRGHITRRGLIIRVDIPAGVVPASFVPEISADGTTVVFSCHMEQSRYVPKYTLGPYLYEYGTGVGLGMQTATQDLWTFIIDKCGRSSDGGEPKDYKRFTLKLPEPCERDLRDPCQDWEINDVGEKGMTVNIESIRSTFYYFGAFTIASKDVTPAIASMNILLRMEDVKSDNPMNSTNLAKRNYVNQQRINNGVSSSPIKTRSQRRNSGKRSSSRRRRRSKSSRRSKSRHRSRSSYRSKSRHRSKSRRRRYDSESSESPDESDESELNNTFDRMSLCSSMESRKPSTRTSSTRKREGTDHYSSGHYSETTSQCRHRMKGKQRQVVSYFEEDERQKLDAMNRDELRKMEKDLEEAMARRNANVSIPKKGNNSVPGMIETNFQKPDTTGSGIRQEEMFSTPSSRLSKGSSIQEYSDNFVSESDKTPSL